MLSKQRDLRRENEDNAARQLDLARQMLTATETNYGQIMRIFEAGSPHALRLILADARRVTAAEIDFSEAVAAREALDKLIAEIESADES
jgi:hypothetical protein